MLNGWVEIMFRLKIWYNVTKLKMNLQKYSDTIGGFQEANKFRLCILYDSYYYMEFTI